MLAVGIALEPPQVELLDRYRQLLWEWNEKINLTRHTTMEKFVTRDVVDSLQLAQLLGKGRAGARRGHRRRRAGGDPGDRAARPEGQPLRIDAERRRGPSRKWSPSWACRSAVYACRAEDVLEMATFDTLVARALASLTKVLTWFKPHWDVVRPAAA